MIRPVRARLGQYFGRIRNGVDFVCGIPRYSRKAGSPRDPALDRRGFFSRAEPVCG